MKRDTKNELINRMAQSLQRCAYIIETIAHLQGREMLLLPTAANARDLVAQAKKLLGIEKKA